MQKTIGSVLIIVTVATVALAAIALAASGGPCLRR